MEDTNNPLEDFSLEEKDGLDDRATKFDLDIGLKLGFMGGLVTVEGAASYLSSKKNASQTQRVVYCYKKKTHTLSLGMEHLKGLNIEHPEVLCSDVATNVCVAVEYGGQAVLTLDKTVTGQMDESSVKGHLRAAVKSIPNIQIDGEGRVELDEDTKKNSSEVQVKDVGDIHLGFAIQTFEDAVRAVSEICTKLTKSTATAVKVHLLPLTVLDNKASRYVACWCKTSTWRQWNLLCGSTGASVKSYGSWRIIRERNISESFPKISLTCFRSSRARMRNL